MASIPVGLEVIFLIDELNKIVDVTMENLESVHRTAELRQQNAPLAGKLKQVVGVTLSLG